jgi:hypothetical protein
MLNGKSTKIPIFQHLLTISTGSTEPKLYFDTSFFKVFVEDEANEVLERIFQLNRKKFK